MSKTPKYFMVEADALPEIFRKVAQAKSLLERGEESTVNGAAQAVGISRSAYYKYKDAVRPFQDMLHGRIVTFQILLKDEPGVLSGVLKILSDHGANILTVTQNLPLDQVAAVTVTIRIDQKTTDLTALFDQLAEDTGVIEFRKI